MQVRFATEGGIAYFPGLSEPVSIPVDDELERLIHAVGFFDRPAQPAPAPRGAADYQTYTITVDDGARQHAVQLTDMVDDPDLKALLRALKARAKAARGR